MSTKVVTEIEGMLKNRQNGAAPNPGHVAMRQPPAELRRLIDGELPFNELEEITVALVATGELEEDFLAQINEHIGPGEPWDQLRHAAAIRRHYVARLVNLWKRIEGG